MVSHVVSLYELTNLEDARISYRLVEISGSYGCELDDGDLVEKNLNLLVKQIALREQIPVALVSRDGKRFLAIPSETELGDPDYALTPHVVTLKPEARTFELEFSSLDDEGEYIGLSFLAYHLRSPLMNDRTLWRAGPSTYFSKKPVNWKTDARDVDVYRGFGFRLIRMEDKVYLGVKITHKYADNAWLVDRSAPADFKAFRMRHFLYSFGHHWFPIQLLGYTGGSIKDAKFQVEQSCPIRNVYEYTMEKAGKTPPNWVRTLDPESAAIQYKYPGKDKRFYGAAALCRLMLKTEHPAVKRVHGLSIIAPEDRFVLMSELVEQHFGTSVFGGVEIRVSPRALRTKPQTFSIPSQVFGRDKVLRILGRDEPEGIELHDLGRARMSMLLDPEGGLAVASGFDTQHLIAPEGLARQIVQDFQERFQKTIRQMAKSPFTLKPVLFKEGGRTLKEQVDAIISALDSGGVSHGHGVLILPKNGKKDLHNFIKRKLLDRLGLQCVSEEELHEFYELRPQNGRAEHKVKAELENRYVSYLRYTALGLLIANRQWPWVLGDDTAYDLYIGIDVLHNTAAFTFFADGGRRCFIRTYESKQKERLPRAQIRTAIYENLKEAVGSGWKPPRSIVIHRDGQTYDCEWRGFQDAVRDFIREGLLPHDVQIGVVEIHKHSSIGLRLAAESDDGLRNPRIGSWFPLSKWEGVVCTTGLPFKFRGTVNPICVKVARGDLELEKVLRDVFWLSQLCWMAPDRCIGIPIDIKLCDDVLRSVSAYADDDEAQYGEDEEGDMNDEDVIPSTHAEARP